MEGEGCLVQFEDKIGGQLSICIFPEKLKEDDDNETVILGVICLKLS